MPTPLPDKPACPLGAGQCPVLTEVARLREECQRLFEASCTDPLTGLFNWGRLMSELNQEMERTRRTGLPTGLIMIDLDHFKQVNDTYGHQFGDAVLRWVSRLFWENIRRLDIACRYGGEEFAIILPGTSHLQALRLAERLCKAMSQAVLKLDSKPVTVTASFGVDVYSCGEDLTAEAFVQRADRYLFEAKAHGRNTVRHRESLAVRATAEVTLEERQTLLPSPKTYGRATDTKGSGAALLPDQR